MQVYSNGVRLFKSLRFPILHFEQSMASHMDNLGAVHEQGQKPITFSLQAPCSADEWWRNFGINDLELQTLAIRILSQTCSSSGCERNWSVFERIHTKRRNRLEHKRLNDLVYTHYNLHLKERQASRKSLTYPISLENIDLTDDWVVEAEDDDAPLLDVDEIDDWMDVADAILDEGEGGAAAGASHGIFMPFASDILRLGHPMCSLIGRACFSSEAIKANGNPTEVVQELYLKMLKSVKPEPVPPKKKRKGTMPPNAWLWSLIENCANREDIKLLFQILQELRIFRLAYLRIYENFNPQLCLKVAEACARAGAIDFGKKALCKHNVYGITPNVASAHYLLLYAKEHNDVKLMLKILEMMKKNSLPLQPTTADIVFSICHNMGNWNLISKLSDEFIKNGVKLHRTAFDIWMEFAAKIGDAPSLWKIEELRSKSGKQHTVTSAFSCAKGYLLEHKPEAAAETIHKLDQNLPDSKKPILKDELQKLANKWALEVSKRQRKSDRKSFATTLRDDISAMVGSLLNIGLEVEVNLGD